MSFITMQVPSMWVLCPEPVLNYMPRVGDSFLITGINIITAATGPTRVPKAGLSSIPWFGQG